MGQVVESGAERAEKRLAAKAEANATLYRGIPRIGAASLYEADLRQFRRREDRKALKRVAARAKQAAIKARRGRKPTSVTISA